MFVDPVNEINYILGSFTILSPTSLPEPYVKTKTPGGHLFLSRTSATILLVAIATKLVVLAPFHTVESPQIQARAKFQKKTAFGKLKAVITAIRPRGFHYSIIKWSGLSEGITDPLMHLAKPVAKSQISIDS